MDLTIQVIEFNNATPPTNLTVDAGNISIGGDSNLASSSAHTVTVVDNTSVEITVSQTGYHSFTTEISNVYSTDKTIYIMLVPVITNIADPDYRRPHPYFFYFTDSCSYDVDVYNASSLPGQVSWYVNNQLMLDNTDTATLQFCEAGFYQIKQRAVVNDIVNNNGCPQTVPLWDVQWANTNEPTHVIPGSTTGVGETGNTVAGTIADLSSYLDDDTVSNVEVIEYKPSFTLTSTSLSNQLDESCCYTKEEEITVTPDITTNRLDSVNSDYELTYSILSPNGNSVPLEQDTFLLSDADLSITFDMTELGTYTVTATLTDTICNNVFTRVLEFETCNFITISAVDCNTFRLDNKSSSINVDFYIDNIDGTQELDTTELIAGEGYLISLNNTSLYTITATYFIDEEEKTEIFVINNFCNIEDCLSNFILDIICEEEQNCSKCPDDIELNRFLLLYNTYFMKINNEYSLNNFYTILNDAKLAELTTIKQVMDKLVSYCERRGCLLNGLNENNSNITLQHCTETVYKLTDKSTNNCKTCK